MAILVLPADADPKDRRMMDEESGLRYCLNSVYSGRDSLRDLIYSVTHFGDSEAYEDEELLGYGSASNLNDESVDAILDSFEYIQSVHDIDKRGGRRVYTEILYFSDEEIKQKGITPDDLMYIGYLCSNVYLSMGFQCLFAVHWTPDERYHIHAIVNSVSYVTGAKWKYDPDNLQSREAYFNLIVDNYLQHTMA